MKVRYKATAGIAVLALAVAACGGGGGGSSKPDAESSQQAQEQAANLPKRSMGDVDYAQVKDGGTLKLAMTQFKTQWNYNQVNGTQSDVGDVVELIMPTMGLADENATVTNAPDYVTSWKVGTTGGKQVVTYQLNEKAAWSDGTPITYKDLVAQWKALNGSDKKYQVSSTDGYDRISSVEKGATDKDVVVTFDKTYPDWKGLFSPLYPAATNETPEAFNKGWISKMPATAGSFKFDSIDATSKTVTFVRDDNWWGRKAKLDKVIFRALDDNATPNAFANGEIDAYKVSVNAANLKRAKEVPNAQIRTAAGPDWRHFTINGSSELLKDKNVRQAIVYYGINRDAIIQSDLKDMDWPVQALNNHIFMNTQKGYVDNSGDFGAYNPEKAKQLLDAAGWKLDGDVRKKDGKELNLNFMIPASSTSAKQEGELTQAMLKEIGVKVSINSVPDDTWDVDHLIPGDFDIAPFSWLGTPFPIPGLAQIYKTPASKDNFGSNFPRIGTPELDAKMAQAGGEMDPDKAIGYANEADKMIWDEVHTLPLYQRPQIVAVKQTLANYGAKGFSSIDWTGVGFTG
ncbi:ABC transporter family substrate-binding protein [Nonomuraea rhizosphaerae]|uniref:ABC transporter family substrate-binding protein n=1 Tax=Nonomuraea rhizosphaerae TaxID=2665663 RepID=UPI001C5F0A84|nr:ABC transporter family substrate-binding protein [Nonomuraea rhizosphaerae]